MRKAPPRNYSYTRTAVKLEKGGSTLVTDDDGISFQVIGDSGLIAVALLEYALNRKKQLSGPWTGFVFSKFHFTWSENKFEVKLRNDKESDPQVLDILDKLHRAINLMVYL